MLLLMERERQLAGGAWPRPYGEPLYERDGNMCGFPLMGSCPGGTDDVTSWALRLSVLSLLHDAMCDLGGGIYPAPTGCGDWLCRCEVAWAELGGRDTSRPYRVRNWLRWCAGEKERSGRYPAPGKICFGFDELVQANACAIF